MSLPRQTITVFRDYKTAPDQCARALELLLKKSVSKAAEPTPEPDRCDGTKVKEDSASVILPD
jgi:hypothetical protein